jgi:hypothetical protein
MGWRGTIRAIGAAQRRAERSAARRHRDLERQHKQHTKMLEREEAAYEVDVYNNYIEILRTVHRDCADTWNWRALADSPPPNPPVRTRAHEAAAQLALEKYQPSLVDRLFGRTDAKRAALEEAVLLAKRRDDEVYARSVQEDEVAHRDWEDTRKLAQRVLAGDVSAYLETITEVNPFGEIGALGSSVDFQVHENAPTEIVVNVNSEDVIPTEVKSLLQSGRLSTKKMPQGQFFELYQDYVCGCILRVARELFALLPLEAAIVTANANVLNTGTGHIENQPIVSVMMSRKTLVMLNFQTLDPSDALKNFVHRMNFKKTKGFAPVEKIRPGELNQ